MISPLLNVPREILTHIAFHLSALSLRALPDPLLTLRSANKALYDFLSPDQNPELYARIYRLKFDDSAVKRRAFTPNARQYTEHLEYCCRALSALQLRNYHDVDPDSVLFAAYLLMLDNDGKNRAQLEWAGIDAYLDGFFRMYMYDVSERIGNDGWPVDNAVNACAIWLMWMLTTPEKLEAESFEDREQLAICVLPYASIPFRYASAHAPPIHYHLPLPISTENDDHPIFSIQTAHGPYPIYRPPGRAWSQMYYASRPLLMPPLAAEAAKLLYQSRRDVTVFPIPQQLPRTRADAIAAGLTGVFPTQEDITEVNSHKAAKLVKRIIWDWDRGVGVVPGATDGVVYTEASRAWDCDWWRLRFCWDTWRNQPRFRPGKVYLPGTLSGLWQGKILIPSEDQMNDFVNTATYPAPLFTEATFSITTRPIYMRLVEHHCTIGQTSLPVPRGTGVHAANDGAQNAWFEGQPGTLRWRTTIDYASGHRKVTICTENGQTAEYRTYEPPSHGEGWTGYEHDRHNCPGCQARADLVSAAKRVQDQKLKEEEEERLRRIEQIERTFSSVGLGRGMSVPVNLGDQNMEVDAEDESDDGNDDDDGSLIDSDYDLNIMEVGEDGESELYAPNGAVLPRAPKSHDWVCNVMECDGVKDVIVTGSTDYAHGQAWHHYTYYGRVRPWDGLIGILRVPRAAQQGMNIMYGYVSGGANFSGNWRFALMDPMMPSWECAVVMSKRDE